MNKRILVTGGTGLVGKHLKDIMPNAIYLSSRDANLLNAKSVDTIIGMNKPDIVIHLAARVGGVLDNITYPVEYLEENTLINTNLLRACHKHDVQKQDGKNPLYKQYFMHGTSHYLGLDVHDVGSIDWAMKDGMVFTCEPGIYILEEELGIRLENDILVTSNNPYNLMGNIPIELEEIEDLMNA